TVKLNKDIVDLKPYKRGERMLHRIYSGAVLFQSGTSGQVNHIVYIRFYYRLIFKIGSLKFNSVIGGGGHECHVRVDACMQPYSGNSYCLLNRMLFRIHLK